MSSVRRAVIDVGTNSIKLLVAEVCGPDIRPVWEDSKQTRLGSGFYETHVLQAEPIAKTALAVFRFSQKARELQAASVRVIATSAARDALNAAELVCAIENAAGLKVEILSGDQEAEWVFQGVATDPNLARRPLLLLDVGGGSTEFIVGQDGHKHFRESFPLGTVRLMERIPHSDPPQPEERTACRAWIEDFLRCEVKPRLDAALDREHRARFRAAPFQLVGTGGTTSILARMEAGLETYDRDRIEATRLSLERLREQGLRLWSLPLAERRKIAGLPPKRADVILTGVLIFEAVMDMFNLSELRISTRGLRFAAVMDAV